MHHGGLKIIFEVTKLALVVSCNNELVLIGYCFLWMDSFVVFRFEIQFDQQIIAHKKIQL